MQLQGHPSRWGSGRAAAAAAATSPTPPAMTQRPVLPPAARRIITAQVSFDPWLRKGSPVSIGCMTFQKSDCAGHTGNLAPQVQQAVCSWARWCASAPAGEKTARCLDLLEHKGERGYSSPAASASGLVPHRAHTGWVRQVHPRCRNARNWHHHDATPGGPARPGCARGNREFVRHRDPGSASNTVTSGTAYSLLVATATP